MPEQSGGGHQARSPWNAEQVASLNGFQTCGYFHPFTCPRDHPCPDPQCGDSTWDHECQLAGQVVLVAGPGGWTCPRDDYTQDWAHGFMADGTWQQMAEKIAQALSAAADEAIRAGGGEPITDADLDEAGDS